MKPLDYLGKKFDHVRLLPNTYVEERRGWLASEGEEPDFTVQLKDGSLEFILSADRVVTTVFVLDKRAIEELLGVPNFGRVVEALKQTFGPPAASGGATCLPVLGKKGAWLRYEFPHHTMHIQETVGDDAVDMVTLMVR